MTPPRPTRTAVALRWVGWWLVVACAVFRCTVTSEPFPHWGLDPAINQLPVTGLTPASSMAVDSVLMFGCAVAMLGEALVGGTILWMPVVLWVIGCVGVAVHAFAIRAGTMEDGRLGVAWCAAMAAGLTAMHLGRDEKLRRVALAAGVGLVALLAAKGALQVFHEHEINMADYRRNRVDYLQSQGMRPGSAAAQNFERRLSQPAATGWFGMSNVYATFAAVSLTALAGCALLAWHEARITRRIPDGWAGLITLGALAAVLALYVADSKGGVGAALVGVALLAGGWGLLKARPLATVLSRHGGLIAVGLIGAVLFAVVLRGLIGERINEPSILFRWFYLEGAVRAFLESPVFGTGPDGFKDAYMRLKPALSPEEVSGPHSVLFDFAARLGVFGLLWAGLWIRWVWGLGVAAWQARADPSPGDFRPEAWFVLLAAAVPVILSTWVERSMGTPAQATTRLAGLAGWAAVTLALLIVLRSAKAARPILAVAALVGAVHGQIDVTPVWDSSAAWMCLMLAAAGAGTDAPSSRSPGRVIPAALLVVASIGAAWLLVLPASRWESALADASAAMRPMAEIRSALQQEGADGPERAQQAIAELSRLTSLPPPRNESELNRAFAVLSYRLGLAATPALDRAVALAPSHIGTREALIRVLIARAFAARESGPAEEVLATARIAESEARELVRIHPSASTWGLLGNVHSSLYELTRDRRHLDKAVDAWATGADLDPHGLALRLQQFHALQSDGRTHDAAVLARRLLELDELQRLDPIKRLLPEDRAAIEKASTGG